ncbi:MAG TPA: YceI family protein [Candidatus Acidoferrales bacterium]|nr:YceI family protein [Candidatus Acidoferrales bacterium]
MKKWMTVAALLAFAALPALAQTTTWQIDPNHTSAQFAVKHLGVSTVRGAFTKTTGTVQLDEKDITKSQVEVTVDTTTLDTRNETRDKDVKSPNFLDVAAYPTMTFKSKRITAEGDGKYKMTGELTLHGVTREVTFDVDGPSPAIQDPWKNLRRGASATATINRRDFGITYSKTLDTGGLVVSNEVQITIDIEFIRKP